MRNNSGLSKSVSGNTDEAMIKNDVPIGTFVKANRTQTYCKAASTELSIDICFHWTKRVGSYFAFSKVLILSALFLSVAPKRIKTLSVWNLLASNVVKNESYFAAYGVPWSLVIRDPFLLHELLLHS
mmetsp:Transcript_3735/g.8160  ORF Transcript_3735/g.8160 Transcript_3735/m.8160 type:complete len:127 (-) Transcript_3735:1303-1683(-)